MAVRLSKDELLRIARSIRLLTSPLEHDSVDAWRLAVNREIRELLGASSAGFLLPGTSMPMLSEEHDQTALAGFPDLLPPSLPDGTPLWNRLIELEVGTLEMAYGSRDIGRYYRSEYYNDYAAANGACETLAACFAVTGYGPGSAASLHFWNDRDPRPPGFRQRDVEILRLLFPAFQAGVHAHLRLGRARDGVRAVIDRLGVPVLVCDAAGRVLHQTPALSELIASEAEGSALLAQLVALATPRDGALSASCRLVATRTARYRLSVAHHRTEDSGDRPMQLLSIERLSPRRRTAEEIAREFGLTPAESRVGFLLAAGKSNAEVACALAISTFTARRHTERVLAKLGLKSRAEVAAHLSF